MVIPSEIGGYPVRIIGAFAFERAAITSVTIPTSVTLIHWGAFHASTIEHVDFVDEGEPCVDNSGLNIDYLAFANTANLASIDLPDHVSALQMSAFQGSGLTSVTFGSRIRTIPDAGFAGTALTSVTIPATVNDVGESAFRNIPTLTTVVIEDGERKNFQGNDVGRIGSFAFADTALTEVTIPGSIRTIEASAFRNIPTMTSVAIEDGVREIGSFAFAGTRITLSSLALPETIAVLGVNIAETACCCGNFIIDENNVLTAYIGSGSHAQIPYGVTEIGVSAFRNAAIDSVYIPNSVVKIGNSAFYDSTLASVVVPNSVIEIDNAAFYNNRSLQTAILGNSVKIIGPFAFSRTTISVIVIPDSVIEIGASAFGQCNNLTEATIGNGVISIGSGAFNGCTELGTITIGNSVTMIGMDAFNNTAWLNKQDDDSLVYIGNVAYIWKGEMPVDTVITFEPNTTAIADSAFSGQQNLVSVTFPNSITHIGIGAFSRCTNLSIVSFDDESKLVSIGNSAFTNTAIISIVIPDSVVTIGSRAFSNTALTTVVIGAGVKEIGLAAFDNATVGNIRTVRFRAVTPPEFYPRVMGVAIFTENRSLDTIYVPFGTRDNYVDKLNGQFSQAINRITFLEFCILCDSEDENSCECYSCPDCLAPICQCCDDCGEPPHNCCISCCPDECTCVSTACICGPECEQCALCDKAHCDCECIGGCGELTRNCNCPPCENCNKRRCGDCVRCRCGGFVNTCTDCRCNRCGSLRCNCCPNPQCWGYVLPCPQCCNICHRFSGICEDSTNQCCTECNNRAENCICCKHCKRPECQDGNRYFCIGDIHGRGDEPGVEDALEILRFLVSLPSVFTGDSPDYRDVAIADAMRAAIIFIFPEPDLYNQNNRTEPVVEDALEILRMLVGLSSRLNEIWI
jgi:hypothetical protein